MSTENNNLNNIHYAEFLEKTLQELITMPVKGICLNAVLDDGAIYTAYHSVSMQNKLTISGLVQQDATLDFLKVNGYIKNSEEE
jgi:hypothetical protein